MCVCVCVCVCVRQCVCVCVCVCVRSGEHTSERQSHLNRVCRLLRVRERECVFRCVMRGLVRRACVRGRSYGCVFFFECEGDRRDLYSFPTRRSSDLDSVCVCVCVCV